MARRDVMREHSKGDITAYKHCFCRHSNLLRVKKESVTRTNAPLVDTLISTGDISESIAIQYNSSIILKGHFRV